MPSLPPSALIALSIASVAASSAAQQEAWRVSGDVKSESFGRAVASVEDHDGDGVRDLLVGAPGKEGIDTSGRVVLLSGSDLSVLLEISGPPGEEFGSAVADVGDVDGDGVGDFFVGLPLANLVRLSSGATGATLLQVAPKVKTGDFGACGVGLGDVDGDGVPDFAYGAPGEFVAQLTPGGVVRIASGATGAALHTLFGSHSSASIGGARRLANAGDLDGDALADLALLDVEETGGVKYGVVRVRSGATGVELLAVKFDQVGHVEFHLDSLANVGDLDGDGLDDLAVGGLPNDPALFPGRVFVLSGATGATLLQYDHGDDPMWQVVGATGDFDGDLVPDLVAATTVIAPSGNPLPQVTLTSGATGVALAAVSGLPFTRFGLAFAAGIDSDGDGLPDVAIADELAKSRDLATGELRVVSWSTGSVIARIEGDAADRRFRGDVALIDDFDGDGTNDFVAADPHTVSTTDDALRVHSGRDGSLLVEHLIPVLPDGELVAVPDLDGDGHDDVAFGESVKQPLSAVEVRSTATGLLLRRFIGTTGTDFGRALDVGLQPNGAYHLAVGAPLSSAGTTRAGEVNVFDLATGALLFRFTGTTAKEQLGSDVASLGDVDGDGVGDWAFGAPRHNGAGPKAGRVVVVSGNNVLLQSLLGAAADDEFGSAVAGIGDLDGDGLPDLAASAPGPGFTIRGKVRLYGSAAWTLLGTAHGMAPGDAFCARLEVLPDLNGDGVREFLASGTFLNRIDLVSGATAALLARTMPVEAGARFATPQPWHSGSANGDPHPDVLVAEVGSTAPLTEVSLLALDDLLLQLDPPAAPGGAIVTAETRGGPPGGVVGLEIVALGGVPVGKFVDLATFDAVGIRSVTDKLPHGLAGLTVDLRAWAIHFSGRTVSSQIQTLKLQ